jgi:phospholipid/cholesterol/gamma-HCH transport system substrate-binding protein
MGGARYDGATGGAPALRAQTDGMETRANYALIGAFTLAVVGAAFMFVFWFSRGAPTGMRPIQVQFTSSVSGLSRGAEVLFNGVRVGEVKDIELAPDDPGRVFARIEVSERAPVKQNTRARLEYQGLTGVASIALDGGTPDAPPLTGEGGKPPVIEADRSDYQNILETLQRLAGRTETAMEKIDRLISDNGETVGRTVRNVEAFTRALDADQVRSILSNAESMVRQINESAGKLDRVLASLDKALGGAEGANVLADVAETARSFRRLADNLDARTKELSAGLTKFTGSGLRQYEALASDARRTLEDVNRTLRSLEKNPQQLLFGRKPAAPEYGGR